MPINPATPGFGYRTKDAQSGSRALAANTEVVITFDEYVNFVELRHLGETGAADVFFDIGSTTANGNPPNLRIKAGDYRVLNINIRVLRLWCSEVVNVEVAGWRDA